MQAQQVQREIAPGSAQVSPPAHSWLNPDLLKNLVAGENGVEKLAQLVALERESKQEAARMEYFDALSRVQGRVQSVIKDKDVVIAKNGKEVFRYPMATLAAIADALREPLATEGFSFQHTVKNEFKSTLVLVRCTLHHRAGHSEYTEMEGPHDDSGQKNRLQELGSTRTYLRRYTLADICGVMETADLDGRQPNGQAYESNPLPVAVTPELTAALERWAQMQRWAQKNNKTAPSLADAIDAANAAFCKTESSKKGQPQQAAQ